MSKIPWFYFLGENKSGIHGTVLHVDIVLSSTETTLPEILYRVWVYADGSYCRNIGRITRDAHVELYWCKLCVCVGGGMPFYVLFCLDVRHGYRNIKVRYHNILWQFCIIF